MAKKISIQSKGGTARAQSLSAAKRKEIARKAAAARWSTDLPQATHTGELTIGEVSIPCYVLETGERVLTTRGMMKGLGRTWRGRKYSGTELPVFVEAKNLSPYIDNDLRAVLTELKFRTDRGLAGEGFKAEMLPIVCDVYLRAREDGKLTGPQLRVAQQCEILMRGLAHVGIIALVDEATGYQYERERNALAEILEAFIKDEAGKWAKRFPDAFYKELFRLKGKKWPFDKNPPQYVGHWTNNIIYKRLAPGVLDDLRSKNPVDGSGRRKTRHHQWLTDDIGHPKLQEHIQAVLALMRASDTYAQFEKMLNRSLPKQPQTATERAQKHIEFTE